MKIDAGILRHRGEFARALRNKQFELTERGLLFPKQGAIEIVPMGHMESWLNGGDHAVDSNVVPTAARTWAAQLIMGSGTVVNPWYVSLFSGNVTPQPTLTAANYVASMTEFTGYSEATRVTYVEGTAAAGAIDNDASRAEFTITDAATLYGGALLSAQAKSAVTGEILACASFAASRAVQAGDTLQVKYTFSLTSA